jgi:hypothetical protein
VWRTNVHRTSGFRHSGIDKVRVLHLVKSRVAIPRINRGRRSGRGHVASDPGYRGSAFGVSGGKGGGSHDAIPSFVVFRPTPNY